MKRIETLTEGDRLAIVRTLNAAPIHGESAYICPGRCVECKDCAAEPECDAAYDGDTGLIKSFRDWLAWLLDEVNDPAISSGYRVLYTERTNHYHIVRPDGENIFAIGMPLRLLPCDYERNTALAITDIFSSSYGAACILVEDTYTGGMLLYSDIF